MILAELHGATAQNAPLAEILGVRLLLVNVLRPLAAGQKLTPEAFDKLLDEISTAKHNLAGKLIEYRKRVTPPQSRKCHEPQRFIRLGWAVQSIFCIAIAYQPHRI